METPLEKKKYPVIISVMLVIILLYQDAITFVIGPVTFSQVLTIAFAGIMFLIYKKNDKPIKLNIKVFIIYLVICFLSIFLNKNASLISSYLYLGFGLFTYKMYIDLFDTKEELLRSLMNVLYVTSIILSVFGIIQLLAYSIGLDFLYNFSYLGFVDNYAKYLPYSRITSLYSEPAHLCMIFGPGIFANLCKMVNSKKMKYFISLLLIIIATIISYSIITYISVVLFVILFIYYNRFVLKKTIIKISVKKVVYTLLIIIVPIFIMSSIVFYNGDNEGINTIKNKINDFKNGLVYSDNKNLTSHAILSNYHIAYYKFKEGKYLGTGLFSHHSSYEYYMNILYSRKYVEVNSVDAASVFIRVFSELGIVGLILFVLLIFKSIFYGFKNKNIFILFIVLLLIVQGMRLGNYTFPLFILPLLCLLLNNTGGKKKNEK